MSTDDIAEILRSLARRYREIAGAFDDMSHDPAFRCGQEAWECAAVLAESWAKEHEARANDPKLLREILRELDSKRRF